MQLSNTPQRTSYPVIANVRKLRSNSSYVWQSRISKGEKILPTRDCHGRPSAFLAMTQYFIFFLFFLPIIASAETPEKAPERSWEKELEIHEKSNAILPLPVELVEETAENDVIATSSINLNNLMPEDEEPDINEGLEKKDSSETGKSSNKNGLKTTILNVNDVDIATLVKTFSKLTGRNYIVDSGVKGKITIHLPTAVTIDEALRIFDTVLLLKGFTTVPVSDSLWKVIKSKDAKQTTIPTLFETPDTPSDALVTRLIHFRHVQASDMQQVIQPFISADGTVSSFEGTNALILIDSSLNIERLEKLIKQLDIPASDQEITIIPIMHADVQSISEKINEILGEEEQKTQSTTRTTARTTRSRRTSKNTAPTGTNVQRRSLPIKIIPDERTNSLIVVADIALTTKVQALVEKLDSSIDRSSGRFYVYRLKHADSEKVSEILTTLISGATAESSSTAGATSGSSISRSKASSPAAPPANTNISSRLAEALRRRTARQTASSESNSGTGKVNFEGEVSITADPSTNSLIINASRSDYEKIKEVLDEIDRQRPQVLVEATILEISLNKEEGMGIELQGTAATDSAGIIGQTNFGGLSNLLTNPAALSDLTIAAASSGTVTLPGGLTIPSQAILISAVSSNQNVNVLSSPTIIATDNEEAEIIVGENVPFVTSTSTDSSNINNTFNQIERQDVGITLRITPQISTGKFIVLKIFVEISNVVAGTRNDPNGPTTTIRTTETTVEVKDGQMVVTGGLISDSVTEATRGVPFLQDIPILGNYFKREDLTQRRTNLLIFITPRVIKNQFDARENTKSYTGRIETVIDEQDANPRREEVLHSDDLDNVVEEVPAGELLPTKITPAKNVKMSVKTLNSDGVKETFEELGKKSPPKAVAEKKEEIVLKVKPKLPAIKKTPVKKEPAKQAALNKPTLGKTYVVLRDISESALPEGDVPFNYANDGGTLGIVVMGPSGSQSSRFFSVGKRYNYDKDGITRTFVCLGRYKSQNEAAIVHSELASQTGWYKLSPQEALTLGKQFWLQG